MRLKNPDIYPLTGKLFSFYNFCFTRYSSLIKSSFYRILKISYAKGNQSLPAYDYKKPGFLIKA
jgi:hypothetical protein